MSTSEILGLIISIIGVIVAIYFGIKQTPKKEVTTITSTIPKDSFENKNMKGIIGNNTTGSISNNVVTGSISNNNIDGDISNNTVDGDISNNKN